MPDRNQTVLDFLLGRRSSSAKLLAAPAPGRAGLTELLTAAARVPDHGMLVPWRFVVLTAPALRRLAGEIEARGRELGMEPELIAKGRAAYDTSPLAVVVVDSPKASDKIPQIEQTYSAGAACLSLLNAALAAGWGAAWVTGWPAYDADFCARHLGLRPGETVAGLVHIGTAKSAPAERPRPGTDAVTTWVQE